MAVNFKLCSLALLLISLMLEVLIVKRNSDSLFFWVVFHTYLLAETRGIVCTLEMALLPNKGARSLKTYTTLGEGITYASTRIFFQCIVLKKYVYQFMCNDMNSKSMHFPCC